MLYPIFGILLSPMIAAAAMSLSSVSVITKCLTAKNEVIEGRNKFEKYENLRIGLIICSDNLPELLLSQLSG